MGFTNLNNKTAHDREFSLEGAPLRTTPELRMRVLLSTYGSRGDVEPLAALAVALQKLGAEAVVCAPGEQEFVDLLARAGVEYAPAFMPVRQWIEEARQAPMPLPKLAARMIPLQYEAIGAAAVGCDAIVATGLFPSVAAAHCVAKKRGLHYETANFCPLSLPSEDHAPYPRPGYPLPPEVTDRRALWALNAQHMNALFGEAINAQRVAIGLPALNNVRDPIMTNHPLLASDPVLWPWAPTDLCDPAQTGAWILPDERALPAELEAFLNAGLPPVYAGFGSIALQTAKDAAQLAVEAIQALGRRVVLARGWADAAPVDTRDDVFLIGEVNQQALFRRCAAIVHHGGAGTTTTAAMAGAPQVIVPQIVDQPYWAARVEGLGIGVAHDGAAATKESLVAALRTALAPETKSRATTVAASMRDDGAMIAAKLLLDTVGQKPHH
jgi:vancomycin aglycone glucosyltransferase